MASDPATTTPTIVASPTPQKITLTGPQETLLATLYGRYKDAANPDPILGDKWAAQVVEKVDYDFAKTGMDVNACLSVAVRARLLDEWTSEFLAAHPSATVLHLACGLDSRCLRVPHGPGVRWIDIDLPDVVTLREKLLPVPEGDYRLIAASATDTDKWLVDIPADRPTVTVLEGLTMYLHEEDGRRLFEAIVKRFATPGGQLLFDCYGKIAIRLQNFIKPVKNTGSVLHWGLDDPNLLVQWCPGLKIVDDIQSIKMPGIEKFPLSGRIQMWLVSYLPYLRDAGRMLRYQF